MILRWLNSVPFTHRFILLVLLVGLIGAVFYSFVWQPKIDEISMLRMDIESLQQKIDVGVSRLGKVPDDMGSKKKNEPLNQQAMVVSAIPPQQFRQEVIKVSNRYGLHLSLWHPGREPSPGTYGNRLPIQGRIEGGYHQIAQGFAALLQLPWVLEVPEIQLSLLPNIDNERSSLRADFHLASFSGSPSVELPSSLKN